jgi:hypothetical protein
MANEPAAIAMKAGTDLGIDLDSAIQAHADWRSKLRTAVARKETMDAETIGCDDCCLLGKWLHGAGKSQYGGKPSFVSLVDAHRQFHQEAGKVARLIKHGILTRVQQRGCSRDPVTGRVEGQDIQRAQDGARCDSHASCRQVGSGEGRRRRR